MRWKQPSLFAESVARDDALDKLQHTRWDLIAEATSVAWRLAQEHGYVTSTMVLAEMERDPEILESMEGKDRRFMGPVFMDGARWKPVGWECTGSHCRPVRRWALRSR